MDKDKLLIEFLQTRCGELWNENESLKFQKLINSRPLQKLSLNENSLEKIDDEGRYYIYSGSYKIGEYNERTGYILWYKKYEINIEEIKNIIKLLENE